ncbi:Uncharacterised protein [Klebsiella pneumoniae]|nr:hypothetical protein AZZ86_004695 [Klebsiella pneumoniae]SXL10108.1 Uncharacterised protein [Klebsiella pneumoniae]VGF99205.1 Uncharacterised protein [Klebsiella pneumoniae]
MLTASWFTRTQDLDTKTNARTKPKAIASGKQNVKSAPVKSHINRLKMLKRLTYRHDRFKLLPPTAS